MVCPTKLHIKCFCFASEVDLKSRVILLTLSCQKLNCGKLFNTELLNKSSWQVCTLDYKHFLVLPEILSNNTSEWYLNFLLYVPLLLKALHTAADSTQTFCEVPFIL